MGVPWVGQVSSVGWAGRAFRTKHCVLGCWMSRAEIWTWSTTGRISLLSFWRVSPAYRWLRIQQISSCFDSSSQWLLSWSILMDSLQNHTLNHITCPEIFSSQTIPLLYALLLLLLPWLAIPFPPELENPFDLHICLHSALPFDLSNL